MRARPPTGLLLSFISILTMVLTPVAGFADPFEATCAPPAKKERPESPLDTITAHIGGYKSEKSLAAYFGCWKTSDANQRNYEKKYRKMVKAASDATGIPTAILSCLYFKESRWNKNASPCIDPNGRHIKGCDIATHARGLAQLMPDTWDAMVAKLDGKARMTNPYVPTNLRKSVPRDKSPLDLEIRKLESYYKAHFDGQIDGKADLTKVQSLLSSIARLGKKKSAAWQENLEEYRTNAQTALGTLQIRTMYDDYIDVVGEPSPSDRGDSTDARTNPKTAIIIGALYLRVLLAPGIYGPKKSLTQDQWIIATGSYNAGPGNSQCDPKMTAEQCIQATIKYEDSDHETSRHMKGIRNCAQNGNRTPMPGDTERKCVI